MSGLKWVMTENDSAGTDPLWTASGWKIAHQCALGWPHLMCNTELMRPGQFLGTVQEYPRREKKPHTQHTHTKRGREESKKRERTFYKFRYKLVVLSPASVFPSPPHSFISPSFLSPISAHRMKLDFAEWVLCSVAGSAYYFLCCHEDWWLFIVLFLPFFPLFLYPPVSSSRRFALPRPAATLPLQRTSSRRSCKHIFSSVIGHNKSEHGNTLQHVGGFRRGSAGEGMLTSNED